MDTVVGRPVSDRDTSALLIVLDPMERNIAAIAAELRRHAVDRRPHARAHTCRTIVHTQLATGAIGIIGRPPSSSPSGSPPSSPSASSASAGGT